MQNHVLGPLIALGLWAAGPTPAQTLTPLVPVTPVAPIPLDDLMPDLAGIIAPPAPFVLPFPDFGGRVTVPTFWPNRPTAPLQGHLDPASLQHYIDILAPGTTWRSGAEMATPGPRMIAFLDYHREALTRLRATVASLEPGTDFDVMPVLEYAYFSDILTLIPLSDGRVRMGPYGGAPLNAFDMELMTGLRLFAYLTDPMPAPLPEPEDPPRLALHLAWQDLPNGSAIGVPFDQTQGQAHRAFRTLTLTATPRGETPPPSVRYLIDSAAPVTPHTPGATCHGERPMECYVSGPAPYELRIELNPPMMFSDDIQAEPDVHITAATWDGAVWTEWDSADWSLTFRHCDRSFTDHLAQLIRQRDGLGHSAERLTRMTRPIDSLPGDRLFPGPIRAARPAPGDLRDMGADGASAILASQVSDLARTRGLDSYLSGAGGLPEAVRAIERYGYLRQCDPERTADLQAALDDQHAAVRRQLAWWRALQRDAQAGRAAWTRRVQEDMAVFDATRLTTPPPDVGEVLERLSRNYTTSKVHQLLTMLATAWDTGATAALRAPLTALGAGLALAQLVGGAIDYDTLLDIEAGVTEATAWMEAEAYLDGLTHRYEEAEALISAAITVTREAERANCTCFRP